jgi:predicted nucleic acid-binding Zn ribbon protein
MTAENSPKLCFACGKVIRGRSDKKFCDDYCRNSFNNRLKADNNNFIRNINNALRKNRRILEGLLPEKEELYKTTKERLLNKSFQFRYVTHTYTNKKGNTYFFCYDYGYLPLDNDWYLIVKGREE